MTVESTLPLYPRANVLLSTCPCRVPTHASMARFLYPLSSMLSVPHASLAVKLSSRRDIVWAQASPSTMLPIYVTHTECRLLLSTVISSSERLPATTLLPLAVRRRWDDVRLSTHLFSRSPIYATVVVLPFTSREEMHSLILALRPTFLSRNTVTILLIPLFMYVPSPRHKCDLLCRVAVTLSRCRSRVIDG